jgi:hypothetical protein
VNGGETVEFNLGEGTIEVEIPTRRSSDGSAGTKRNRALIDRALIETPRVRSYNADDLGLESTKQLRSAAASLYNAAKRQGLRDTMHIAVRDGRLYVQYAA